MSLEVLDPFPTSEYSADSFHPRHLSNLRIPFVRAIRT